jgi:hypothetical protein
MTNSDATHDYEIVRLIIRYEKHKGNARAFSVVLASSTENTSPPLI